jgi:hypothetical protein
MTKDEMETIQTIIRVELCSLTEACIAPLSVAVAQVLERQIQIEKALAAMGPDDDGEDWRRSLEQGGD